ncbi:YhcN/YlaJ family sporulation lipoprotein [Cohnella ginsengisoli]|uniref:YhcN/YlaJ family sporulation lipoprotein n=1 Tax=Cohnella ginsengisoli TaxID=425004 RepID=A0A9X4KJW9_9BACL|nr:YhcN/YlaJ family sporulation lipoprotein [Cohnella ginsengisoli]MDG0793256.1 YhcN/YlaJ family sporulation lipoprotein [Cohnella ginsengisoli]
MDVRKPAKAGLILLLASALLSAAGCGNRTAAPAQPDHNRLQARSAPGDGVSARDGNVAVRPNAKAVASHLEQLAEGVRGVRHANCVIFGKYAVVGIDVDPKMERSRVGTTKYAVAEAFRKDPYGVDALVTADMDMAERIREIRADAKRGRPIAGFAEEMADIIGRLVPQVPRSIVPPASPDGNGPAAKSHANTSANTQRTQ